MQDPPLLQEVGDLTTANPSFPVSAPEGLGKYATPNRNSCKIQDRALMIKQPKLKNHLHVEIVGNDKVLLIAEGRYFALSGRVYARIMPLIDGERHTEQIVDKLQDEFSQTEIYHALLILERNGHIEESFTGLPDSIAAFWNTFGVDTQTLAKVLAAKTVSVTCFGDVPKEEFLTLLEKLYICIAPIETAQFSVALVDDYLQDGLEEFNQHTLKLGRPWLIAKPNGIYSWIGPLFQPGETGCWACLAQRLRNNYEVEEFARRINKRIHPYPALASLPATMNMGLSMAAIEVAKWLVLSENTTLKNKLITFDTGRLQIQEHTVVRRPQCLECGDAEYQASRSPSAVVLNSVCKTFVADGGHRAVSPEETLKNNKHHISPLTGIAKSLIRVTDQDNSPLHVYMSGHNMAVRYDSFQKLRRHIRGSSCGKGITDAQAQASALCEAIERYSGVFRGEEIRRKTSADALGTQAINPQDCMLFSEAQYRDRDEWNARDRRLDMIPLPFDQEAEIDWTPLWSLTHKEFRYLPTSYCYYSYPSLPEHFFCLPDSNGSAAGNTKEEAILQGFMELVERDSVATWWYNQLRKPAVDLDSFDDPYIQNLRQYYHSIHRELWVLDLTNDLEIPAFIAISRRIDRPLEDIIFAPAAHFDPRLGIVRALTELNQMLPGVSTSKPDGTGYSYDDPEAIQWWRTATLANQPYLAPCDRILPRRRSDYKSAQTDDLRDDILLCQSLVERLGLEMLVLDQTRPDIGLSVVKVVVPGLRHFWARFAPGRLYDVPVKMGWLTEPISETALNPVAIFI